MTDAVQVALIAGVPIFITALGGLVVAIRTAFKTEEIHTATNGTLHEMRANDKVQAERITGMLDKQASLEKQIAMLLEDKKATAEIAKTLADGAKAHAELKAGPDPATEANTEAIVDNTVATDLNTDVRAGIQPKKWGSK